MRSFPWDSVAEKMGEDGLPLYDRSFDSDDIREIFGAFFTDGVFMSNSSSLQVVVGDAMNVTVKAGKCMVKNTVGVELEDRTLALQGSNATYDRIDTVVARWNANVDARYIELYVVQGTPAQTPTRPTLNRSASVWEIGLADVYVTAGSSAITQQRITDTRLETERCGAVTPHLEFPTDTWFLQIQALVDEFLETVENAIDGTLAGQLQQQIEDNEAGNLAKWEENEKRWSGFDIMEITPEPNRNLLNFSDSAHNCFVFGGIAVFTLILAFKTGTTWNSGDITIFTLPEYSRPVSKATWSRCARIVTTSDGDVYRSASVESNGSVKVSNTSALNGVARVEIVSYVADVSDWAIVRGD